MAMRPCQCGATTPASQILEKQTNEQREEGAQKVATGTHKTRWTQHHQFHKSPKSTASLHNGNRSLPQQAENFSILEASWFVSFGKGRVTCPCRNEGSSFVLVEGGKEVPKPCLALAFLSLIFSSRGRSGTGDAFLFNVSPRHRRRQTQEKTTRFTQQLFRWLALRLSLWWTPHHQVHTSPRVQRPHHNGHRSLPMHTEGSDLVHGRHHNSFSGFQAVHLHHQKPGNGQGGIGHRVGGAEHSNKEC